MKKLFALCLTFFGLFACGYAPADKAISWGINPNTNEVTPTPPAGGVELLEKYNGIFVGDTSQKQVYFTFDLGYEAGYTAEVLDLLKEHEIKAIFFLCGNYLKETELVNRMINEGHAIGNHTDQHKDLPTLSRENIRKDIADFATKFNERYSSPINYFRPPKGRINESSMQEAQAQKLKTIMWSIAIVDWGREAIDAEANAHKINRRIHPGAICLFHITNAGMPKMLQQLIPLLTENGYTFGDATKL